MTRARGAFVATALALCVALTACTPAAPSVRQGAGDRPATSAAVKRVKAVVMAELPSLISTFDRVLPGADTVETMVAAGLVNIDDTGKPRAQLAETVPSVSNGLWKLFPDGTMEMTWKLRDGLAWHDGMPLTAQDLAFTLTVARDPDLPGFRRSGTEVIQSWETPDPRTLVLRWGAPFIEADRILSVEADGRYVPLPRHLLERAYTENKEGLRDLSYWAEDYVGSGPYQLKQWVRGSYFVLGAFDRFALGRPQIDEIEVHFVPEANGAISYILAGEAELLLGRGLDLTQADEAAVRWTDGKMDFGYKSWVTLWPQFINPDPPIITNLQFRRALLYASDRQQMVDTFMNGLTSVAHSYLSPKEPEYSYFEKRIMRYEYDPQRAAQELAALGYSRGPDGLLRDSAGQPLAIEVRTTSENTLHRPTTLILQDYFQRVGVRTEAVFVPLQRQRDQEYRVNKPGFEVLQGRNDLTALSAMHGRNTALPENNYTGGNNSRYINPQFDGLIDRYYATIPPTDRLEAVAQLMQYISENLNSMGLYYSAEFSLIGNHLVNVRARQNGITSQAWNIQEWDLK